MSGSQVKATRRDIRRTIGRSSEAVLEAYHQRLSVLEEQAATQAKASQAMLQHIDGMREEAELNKAYAKHQWAFLREHEATLGAWSQLSLRQRFVWLFLGRVAK